MVGEFVSSESYGNMLQTPATGVAALIRTFSVGVSVPIEINSHLVHVKVVSIDPYLIQVEDLLSVDEIESILCKAEISEGRSETRALETLEPNQCPREHHIKNTWFWKNGDSSVGTLERRIQVLCGFPSERIEALQMRRYPPGKFIAPHNDSYKAGKEDAEWHLQMAGDRSHTWVIYLSGDGIDASHGVTRFINLGVEIIPKPGRAIFWCNLHSDGSPDFRTLHESAPSKRDDRIILTSCVRDKKIPI